ncbi:MAG: tRNA pseudouridine(13) synthase TruD [Caldilineaceae bacterium]|nr:tRNA pseudouridine(13) synthase TruD [Caldilineaceae bacterium]
MLESTIDLTLPYVTAAQPGIGGQLRASVDHFVVEELPLYEPTDEGQHLYVNLTKSGLTTKELQANLARLRGLNSNEVGFAGLKDKYARTTQTFSLPVTHQVAQQGEAGITAIVAQIQDALPVTVHWARYHRNKLKPGHLLGNQFKITVTDLTLPPAEIRQRAEAIVAELRQRGLPNFFGAQRFGREGANVGKGLALLQEQRRERNPWLRKFLIASYQSYLCNCYLSQRLAMDAFDHLLLGDVAKKYATGGMFDVVDLAAEQARYVAQEISFTAPLFGSKMWAAKEASATLEQAILAEAQLPEAAWQKAKVEGTRRLGRLLLPDLAMEQPADDQITLRFSLPKGAFATVLLRELMKVDLSDGPPIDSDADLD